MAGRQALIPGQGYVNQTGTRQALVPGQGYLNETVATVAAPVSTARGALLEDDNQSLFAGSLIA